MSVYLAISKSPCIETQTGTLQFILPFSHLPSTAKVGCPDHLPFNIGKLISGRIKTKRIGRHNARKM